MIRGILSALQLYVAPILAGAFTLWAAAVALAAQDDQGVPRLLTPSRDATGPLSTARGLHVAHTGLLAVAAALAGLAMAWWAWPFPESLFRLFLAALLVWILGDLAPRLWAANEPGLVRFDGRVVQHTFALLRPLLTVVAWADRGGRPRRAFPAASAPAVPTEREMVAGLLGLAEMTVAEVMTPRLDIASVDFSAARPQVVEAFREAGHSRLLVLDGDPDSVTGVLYAKDLLPGMAGGDAGGDWHGLIRPVDFVPEGKTLDRQLRDFQRSTRHLAVVVDEFGGTSGLVTLEDVLEQIVGEIRDEYDTDEAVPITRTEAGRWLVQGNVALADLEAELGHGFGREDVSTVGGLVLALFGRVPKSGEGVALDGFRFTVDQVARRRVRRVTVEAVAADGAAAPPRVEAAR